MTMYWFHPERNQLKVELDNHCKAIVDTNGYHIKVTLEMGEIVDVERKENAVTVSTSPRAA